MANALRCTGSKLQLARACAFPFGKEATVTNDSGKGEAARWGNAFHACAAYIIETGDITPDEITIHAVENGVSDDLARMVNGWQAHWQNVSPPNAQAELALAYDATTDAARVLGKDIGRDYELNGAKDHELCMSLDVVGLDDTSVNVIDHKSGRRENITPAPINMQLRAGAYVWALICNRDYAKVAIHHVDELGTITVDAAEFDAWELGAIGRELQQIARDIAENTAPQPGTHCAELYCPALAACPAQRKAISEIISSDQTLNITNAADLQGAYDKRIIAERLLKKLKKAEGRYVEARGGKVSLPDGRTYRRIVSRGRRRIDTGAVRATFGSRFDTAGPEIVSYAVRRDRAPRAETR